MSATNPAAGGGSSAGNLDVSSSKTAPGSPGPGAHFRGETLSIVLPLPPSVNRIWAPVRTRTGAKLVKRGCYADWSAMAAREVRAQRQGASIAGQFRAAILVPDDGPWDIDNLVKPLLDACQRGGAIANDKHMLRLWVDADDTRQGTVLVEITPLPPAGGAPGRTKGPARMRINT